MSIGEVPVCSFATEPHPPSDGRIENLETGVTALLNKVVELEDIVKQLSMNVNTLAILVEEGGKAEDPNQRIVTLQ